MGSAILGSGARELDWHRAWIRGRPWDLKPSSPARCEAHHPWCEGEFVPHRSFETRGRARSLPFPNEKRDPPDGRTPVWMGLPRASFGKPWGGATPKFLGKICGDPAPSYRPNRSRFPEPLGICLTPRQQRDALALRPHCDTVQWNGAP